MINGSCLCGEVKYQISGKVDDIVHCHCQSCRKAHAAAFSSVASVRDDDFHLVSETPLSQFESSPGKYRFFCSQCGSQIYAKRVATEHIILRLGTLDDDPKAKAASHIWLSEKACWYSINDELPQFHEFQ